MSTTTTATTPPPVPILTIGASRNLATIQLAIVQALSHLFAAKNQFEAVDAALTGLTASDLTAAWPNCDAATATAMLATVTSITTAIEQAVSAVPLAGQYAAQARDLLAF